MKKLILPCLVAVATAAMATTAWSDDTDTVVTEPAKTKVVCKKEPVMGTRIPQRVCKTQAQIDADKQNAKEATNAWQKDANMQRAKGN
jgi:hypothetical protein